MQFGKHIPVYTNHVHKTQIRKDVPNRFLVNEFTITQYISINSIRRTDTKT